MTIRILVLSLFLGSCSSYHTKSSRDLTSRNSASDYDTGMNSPDRTTFDWPVQNARFTRGYLPNKRRPHLGIDLAAPKGTPILASQSGIVVYAGRDFKGYGNMILIENGQGWASLYAHLNQFFVTEGSKVKQGEVIGAMGSTGRATGVHLHYEIRKNKGPVDPLPLLPAGPQLVSSVKRR
ncbi:MAG: M23 family metallopeptidase [Pseudobdellovibrionaceae bacterium]